MRIWRNFNNKYIVISDQQCYVHMWQADGYLIPNRWSDEYQHTSSKATESIQPYNDILIAGRGN